MTTTTAYPPISLISSDPPVSGFIEPGFERVKDQFIAHFKTGKGTGLEELGSSFAAFYKGRCVVCLFGGYADQSRTKLFDKDTLAVIFSSGKSVMSCTMTSEISKGKIGWDTKIASVWPEFGAGGKQDVTVKDLCEHMGGVAWLEQGFQPSIDDLRNLDRLAFRIAGSPHNYRGKLTKTYHAITRGWFLSEILRRVHPAHKSHGQVLREDLNPKLGMEIYCGLPPALHSRVSKVVQHPYMLDPPYKVGPLPPDSGKVMNTSIKGLVDVPKERNLANVANSINLIECESPSAYTVTNAFSLARLGSVMSRKGEGWFIDEKTWKEAHTLEERLKDAKDTSFGAPVRTTWAGWMNSFPGSSVPQFAMDGATGKPKKLPKGAIKPGWSWTGWFGFGGSCHQWDPAHEVAIGYVPNLLHPGLLGDERSLMLTLRLTECVEEMEKKAKM